MTPRHGQPADPHPATLAALALTTLGLAWLLARHREALLIRRRR